ncbi:MAG: tetrathionate reductase subunit TtrA, partial [Chromatiales bacterium]|nr:tetrathionate reductase subunit TtrA [Chromatiales bacterium]
MTTSRRKFLKGAAAAGGLTAFGFGYSHTAEKMLRGLWSGDKPADPISGKAPKPEFTIDTTTGQLIPNPDQAMSYTMCMGCTTICGVRVRVDRTDQSVMRVTGNPYHLLSTDQHIPYATPVKDSFVNLSRYMEQGLAGRSTACARGNAVLSKLTDPNRVKVPLKRVGPRGSGQWIPISPEQLLEEVVEGGNLFGEGHVDGLRAIRDIKTPIDPSNPEFGPKSNQLAVIPPFKDGRLRFAARFAKQSFGTVNFTGHRSYCGLSMRSGYAALLADWKKQPHLKPDFANSEFLLFIGTAPGNAGNPFKRQGQQLAKARSEGKLEYVVVDPVLTNSDSMASDGRSSWLPIKPNTDGALVMGMIRWIIENERFDDHFLKQPNPKAAKVADEVSWSNATHLVIIDEGHKLQGRFLRATDIGLATGDPKASPLVVIEKATNLPANQATAGPAQLFYEGVIELTNGDQVAVKSSLSLLKDEAFKHTLTEYSELCGIPEAKIIELADKFTSHGKRAAADCHGGTMGSNGFYTAYAIVMLNALVGNLNVKGGTTASGGRYKEIAPGPRYNLKKFPGMVKAKGVGLGRHGFPYEKSSEYKRKVAAGQNPYPSQAPWYPLSPAMSSEFLTAALNGYPYSLKALILWSSNPIYGIAGLHNQVKEKLADPKALPLIVSIDPFINETNTFADYIVPDSVLYESWGWASAWGGNLTRVSTARWPVVEPAQVKDTNNQSVDMEWFFIQVAKKMGLPGFGDKAIKDKDGKMHPLNTPEDFYLRAAANVAFDGGAVADADDNTLELTGVDRLSKVMQQTLKPEEWRKVAYVYARGGRFEDFSKSYKGNTLARQYKKPMQIYDERLGTARNTMSGQRYIGTPTWVPPSLSDGASLEQRFPKNQWPFKVVSTKSQFVSSHTAGIQRLQQFHPSNAIAINSEDAQKLGISSGEKVRISTPGGSVEAVALVRNGIAPGV